MTESILPASQKRSHCEHVSMLQLALSSKPLVSNNALRRCQNNPPKKLLTWNSDAETWQKC